MRFNENWTVFFQKSVHSSQNIILATFFKKKLFRTKNYLKKIITDFRKFIESISGGKKKISKNFAPTLNFLTNFTSASLSRALSKKIPRECTWSGQCSPKISDHFKSMTCQETQNTLKSKVGVKLNEATEVDYVTNK